MRKLYARSRAIVRIVRNVFHSTMFVVPPFRYIYELGNCHHWLPFVYIFGMPVVYIYTFGVLFFRCCTGAVQYYCMHEQLDPETDVQRVRSYGLQILHYLLSVDVVLCVPLQLSSLGNYRTSTTPGRMQLYRLRFMDSAAGQYDYQ